MSYLKNFRKQHDLTRQELADMLGCSYSLIAHIEKNIRRITPENALLWEKRTNGQMSRRDLVPEFFNE